jgi:dTDP-glucose pyrophosphorylase
MFEPRKFLIAPDRTIADAIALIDANSAGIVLVVDGDERFVGTVTDGDVRRALLHHLSLETPVRKLLERPAGSPHAGPVTAPSGTPTSDLLVLMRRHALRQIPILDGAARVVDLAILEHLALGDSRPVRAVVMAGGYGTRLAPLTLETPKPMLPIGDQPLMERLVRDIRDAGIRQVHVTTHYRPEKIHEHFGSGADLDVDLAYVTEEAPLGTAGALRLVEPGPEPLLVVNGDILTKVNFRALIRFHEESGACLTVGVRSYEIKVPYGVVETRNSLVTGIVEKPTYRHFVNAGLYVVEPRAIAFIPEGKRFDMTDLIERLIAAGERVASFPVREYWLDIGRHEDYERAQRDHDSGALG